MAKQFQIRNRDFVHISEIFDSYLREGDVHGSVRKSFSGPIPTGFKDLDQILGGLQRSNLVILAAQSGLGKTALALSIARNAARYGATSAIFSLEMSRNQLGNRLLAAEADIDSYRLRQHLYSESQERRILDASNVLTNLPIYIDDTTELTIEELCGKAQQFHKENNIDLIIVDHLQLLRSNYAVSPSNRHDEKANVTRQLKALAKELNVSVLANSTLHSESVRKPRLGDLPEVLEQDADVVMFIYREDLNYSEDDWASQFPLRPYPHNIAEIIVAKHRHGAPGSTYLRFEDRLTMFENMPENVGAV